MPCVTSVEFAGRRIVVSKRTTGAAGTDAASVAPAQNEPRTQAARAVTDDDAFFDLWLRA